MERFKKGNENAEAKTLFNNLLSSRKFTAEAIESWLNMHARDAAIREFLNQPEVGSVDIGMLREAGLAGPRGLPEFILGGIGDFAASGGAPSGLWRLPPDTGDAVSSPNVRDLGRSFLENMREALGLNP